MATVTFSEKFNNAVSYLNGAITNVATTINVDSATALGLDNSTTSAYLSIISASSYRKSPLTSPETLEIVHVTAVSTNALTVTRGADNTTGLAFDDNDIIEMRNNVANLVDIQNAITDGTDDIACAGISANGDIILGASGVNKARSWNIPISAMKLHSSVPPAAGESIPGGDFRYDTYDFDATTAEYIYFYCDLGPDYDGSALTFSINWTAASGSGTVQWLLEIGMMGDDDALNQSVGNTAANDTLITANDLHVATVSGTPAGGNGSFLACRMRRNPGGDTLAVDAQLLGVGISYT